MKQSPRNTIKSGNTQGPGQIGYLCEEDWWQTGRGTKMFGFHHLIFSNFEFCTLYYPYTQ